MITRAQCQSLREILDDVNPAMAEDLDGLYYDALRVKAFRLANYVENCRRGLRYNPAMAKIWLERDEMNS